MPFADRRARIEAICEAALGRELRERAAFVAVACGSDRDLRHDVEALLANAQAAEGFLSTPLAALAADVFAGAADARPSGAPGRDLTGLRLDVYDVGSLLGAGGMGEVYRARDTTLDRDVAIKILPPHFTSNADRLARFEREARLLATLNHPHIGAIYGTLDVDNVRGLILELVDGPTLADRLAAGPLPLDQALAAARQIAQALEAAHEKGIVHRDLKPSNIKLSPDGRIKVIDFGLAKASGSDASDAAPTPAPGPHVTQPGVILGSAAYMSPEQARGRRVDKRTDVWAFGCVLFEMLTGTVLFHADTAPGSLAKVIEREPDWSALPADVPPSIVRLLKRCLTKNADDRLHDIADARLEIADALSHVEEGASRARTTWSDRRTWMAAACVLLAAAGGFWTAGSRQSPRRIDDRVQRLSVLPPPEASVASEYLSLSPDGRFLAFTATSADGRSRLWVRPLDGLAAAPLAGTDDARYPFWSPDSRFIAFFAQHQLKRVPPDGGPAQVICDAPYGFGGTWSRDGVVVFAPDTSTFLYRVAANGGEPTPVTRLDRSNNEVAHWSPAFLPDGKRFLYTAHRSSGGNTIHVGSLESQPGRRVVDADSAALFAPTEDGANSGHLVFVRHGTLLAQRFDVGTLEASGDAIVLADATIPVMAVGAAAPFSVSRLGVLAYRSIDVQNHLTWFDRSGTRLGALGSPERYNTVEIAPDGRHVAVERIEPRDGATNVWLIDSGTGLQTQFTFSGGVLPKWSPDGRLLVFNHERTIFQKRVDGGGVEEPLYRESDGGRFGGFNDWLPDASAFVMRSVPRDGGSAKGTLFLVRPGPPAALTAIEGTEFNGRFSPDGKWLAYSSDANGVQEIFVQPFPFTGAKWLVSHGGGIRPRWRSDGQELFFVASSNVNGSGPLMAVPVEPRLPFRVGTPKRLLDAPFTPSSANQYSYSVGPDGQRILVIEPGADAMHAPFTVVLNWGAVLEKR